MRAKLKALDRQVMVITGASSGIGLVTARAAARRGARLVLAARNEQVLKDLCDEIRAKGGEAIHVVADVGREEDVRRIADAAIRRYGGFDTWVNGAAVSIYGDVEDVTIEDQRRLFDTNYWGVVYGSRIAADHLRERGGAIVNIGSVLSDRAIPVQGIYSASKSAVKAFTVALRMELERDGAPVSVTLIKPSAIDTPYMRHAKNYLPVAPKNPPPIYAPDLVADAILHAAEHPVRDIVVGGGGRLISTLGMLFPRLTDKVMERTMTYLQQTDEPSAPREENNLYEPREDGHERSRYADQHVFERSVYTRARLHPVAASLVALGVGAAAAAVLRGRATRG
ncbi:short-chain dehydrogenase [Sulfurifustis variabilis]|uniref:Short-chain dehydrogenase n=1 Tax=Sulfurifustis variabilis TaxID=1675686 RepID=A0A1B4V637_9GAMM|nr:SDR family oxidoreductase [Sulfurifustis variabilis]BAU48978.1 short-chain dehydrogenase [Sulfurifustis variabilis]